MTSGTFTTIFRDRVDIFATTATSGWTFNDTTAAVPTGVYQAGCDELDGWDDSGPIDALVTSRGQVDGDIAASLFPARSRDITMSGWVLADARVSALQARTALKAIAFPRSTDLYLIRHEPDATKYLTVRLAGQVEYPIENNAGFGFRFSAPLVAVDPFKYSFDIDIQGTCGVVGVSSGGFEFPLVFPLEVAGATGQTNQLSLVNAGDEPTGPICTITGPLAAGWRLSNETTGEYLVVNVDVPPGTDLTVDCRSQVVRLGDQVLDAQIDGEFWRLVPGTNTVKLFGEYDPAAALTINAQSAWG